MRLSRSLQRDALGQVGGAAVASSNPRRRRLVHAKPTEQARSMKQIVGIQHRPYFPWLLMGPTLAILLAVGLFPFGYSLYLAGTNIVLSKPYLPRLFMGLGQYQDLVADSEFANSLRVTVVFTFSAVFIEFWAGLGLALLFHRSIAGKSIYRLGILIPMIVPPVVVGLIWKYLTYPHSGLVTYFSGQFLALFGLPPFPFFASSSTSLATLIFVDVWQWTPFMFLILHAGLSSMPNEPYEAAEIDGASPLRIFWTITLPLLKPSILIALVIRTMDAFRTYDTIAILNSGRSRQFDSNVQCLADQSWLCLIRHVASRGPFADYFRHDPCDELLVHSNFQPNRSSGGALNMVNMERTSKLLTSPKSAPIQRNWWVHVILIVVTMVAVVPVFWVIMTAFMTKTQTQVMPPTLFFTPTFAAFDTVIREFGMLTFMLHSIIIAVSSTFFSITIGTFCAYALARFSFPGKDDVAFWILTNRMMPAVAVILPIFMIFQTFYLLDSYTGLIFLYTAMQLPFVVWMLQGYFEDISAGIRGGGARQRRHLVRRIPQGGSASDEPFYHRRVDLRNDLVMERIRFRALPDRHEHANAAAIGCYFHGFDRGVVQPSRRGLRHHRGSNLAVRGLRPKAIRARPLHGHGSLSGKRKSHGHSHRSGSDPSFWPDDRRRQRSIFQFETASSSSSWSLRLRQDDDTAHDRRTVDADQWNRGDRRAGCDLSAAEAPQRWHGLPAECSLRPPFGLRQPRLSAQSARSRSRQHSQKVEDVASVLQIGDILRRMPSQLSGGQSQRVAIGRMLIREADVFLMDEPISHLDAKLRTHMRAELRHLQKQLGVTTLFVTHDQLEAMSMADQIMVMDGGVIQQFASRRRSSIVQSISSSRVSSANRT